MRKTVLNDWHRRHGARMVDFGGWEMPLHYGSQIDEHHAVRREAGVFDVSHMCAVDIGGRDARAFLRRLLANDVARLQLPGKALYSTMLNESGGVIDDLIVYHLGEQSYRVVVNAATADRDLAWMVGRTEDWQLAVSIAQRRNGNDALAMIAVQGPLARGKVAEVLPEQRATCEALKPFFAATSGQLMIARTGYTGEDGFEISLPAAQAESLWAALVAAGVSPCGLGARDTLRLEAGMNLYGQDMDESVSPFDAGLGWTVDLESPRDFVGRSSLVARGQRHQFLGLVLLDRGVLRAHQAVRTEHGEGEVTSGSFSPTMAQSIALARLPLASTPGDRVQVLIRDRLLAARVVKPCFVRNGHILV
ncbi:glycine cleavage system aminomethyltransferase GcvT [Accumulibacter sp.]|uniref:glycine cleavage system aminomethyltransferase GcvT n=1 Tax=Accumulibacter sp. TaxID=2053492 RepID=UPI0025E9581C|nr:glycine cleavage system aminomethyltransferase GcvT [Accumulibacter sp.]MCM8594278.1 glycine cleavage system aminomethyltransferase GcvT [Accumulibacter sp.]MCM8627899.1 glycine cleavage system aminomethyltransferase GcvT [Accumulibacter sp.]MDS4048422.1 glycine cleavage system aminomethyltransferase GcvT [Accumulibacter sp.]